MKLGVFDSGIGGEAIALALTRSFPSAQIDSINDRKNVPYGDRSDGEVYLLTHTAIQPFLDGTYDVVILACNTATAVAIERLRDQYPSQKFIGIEPMIKTASHLTKSNIIGVCATPGTLSSRRYAKLVQAYGQHLNIIEPDCSQWAYLIESNQINKTHIESTIHSLCDRGADVIVLGCTHYHWIKELIVEIADERVIIIEPSEAISRRVRQLIAA